MKSNLHKLSLVIFLTNLIILPVNSMCAATVSSSREENLKKASQLYWEGKQLMGRGNYQAANEVFKKAQALLEDKPSIAQWDSGLQPVPKISLKAESRNDMQKEESEEVYLKNIKARIKKADIYYDKAVEFIKNKQYQPAEEILEEVVKLNSRDKDAYYNLGVLNEAYLSNKKKALLYYQKFIELAPDSQDAKEVRRWIEEINKQQGVR